MIIKDEDTLVQAVLDTMEKTPDPRLRQVMTALARHLLGFVREIRPTVPEWEAAIRFVAGLGQATTDTHNETILASDTLGVSTLVGLINHADLESVSEGALLGPFWRLGVPDLPDGATISRVPRSDGIATLVGGTVTAADGTPIEGALIDVWQSDPAGFYDNQDPTIEGTNLRGRFRSGADGRYAFATVQPAGYPVPTHGPAGSLILAQGRSHYRPAHLHFMVSAPGCETLITQIFVEGAPHLDDDVTFSVMPSLIGRFEPDGDGGCRLDCDFVLSPGEPRFPPPPIK